MKLSLDDALWIDKINKIALDIRKLAFEQLMRHNGGYFSQVCSSAELLACLYDRILRLSPAEQGFLPKAFTTAPSPQNPLSEQGKEVYGYHAPYLDRLIISPAHYALAQYCALVATQRLDQQALQLYMQDGSSMEILGAPHCPGFELNSQSPLMALSQAIGICIGRKLKKENGRVWVLCHGEEFEHALGWEILRFLKQMPLNNLVLLVDQRGEDGDGLKLWKKSIEALNWESHAFDGQDPMAFHEASTHYPTASPLFLFAQTHPAAGVPYLAVANLPMDYLSFKNPIEKINFEAAVRASLYQPIS
jgi:transketolase